jgi:hypothetical protein
MWAKNPTCTRYLLYSALTDPGAAGAPADYAFEAIYKINDPSNAGILSFNNVDPSNPPWLYGDVCTVKYELGSGGPQTERAYETLTEGAGPSQCDQAPWNTVGNS